MLGSDIVLFVLEETVVLRYEITCDYVFGDDKNKDPEPQIPPGNRFIRRIVVTEEGRSSCLLSPIQFEQRWRLKSSQESGFLMTSTKNTTTASSAFQSPSRCSLTDLGRIATAIDP